MDTRRKLAFKAVLPMVGALLYGASPIDLIPDLIPLVGLMDDIVIVPTLLLMAFVAYRKNQRVLVQAPIKR
ncbi:DUF1232 domain-containing protein [bacterium]|nr:MAG: DUF1232 domain-containing protein [bacterium]